VSTPGAETTAGLIEPRRAFEFVEQIEALDDPDIIVAAFQREAGKLGYSTVALGELPTAGSLPAFFISTWPRNWVETYVGEGFTTIDPSIAYARSGHRPATWREICRRDRAARSDRVWDAATCHGWPDGIAIPVHGPGAYHGLVCLAGETADLAAHDRVALHLMGLYLHERLKRLLAPQLTAPSNRGSLLSRGEIECIRWLLAGKSDWEIGEILNIAEATAHWRIEQAKRKLGVKTRAQLTAVAILNGYLRP